MHDGRASVLLGTTEKQLSGAVGLFVDHNIKSPFLSR